MRTAAVVLAAVSPRGCTDRLLLKLKLYEESVECRKTWILDRVLNPRYPPNTVPEMNDALYIAT